MAHQQHPRQSCPAAGRPGHLAVLDASPNAIVAVDGGGLITYANPQAERTFGYAVADLVGQPVEILLPDRIASGHAAHRAAFAANPVARPMGIGLDLSGAAPGRARVPGRDQPLPRSRPRTARRSSPPSWTSRRARPPRPSCSRRRSWSRSGRLAGGIAHDFNNMVFAIRGYAEMLAEDLEPERRRRLRPRPRAAQCPGDRRGGRSRGQPDDAAAGLRPPPGGHAAGGQPE